MNRKEADKMMTDLLSEISDVLEGGDVRLDFEDWPAYAVIIDSINALVSHHLRSLQSFNEMMGILEGLKND
jgi:hypothetical protein|tara:strand:- start:9417 stop:9629 length:213 start_codon:yes stop_codon:yes gene_type:complete